MKETRTTNFRRAMMRRPVASSARPAPAVVRAGLRGAGSSGFQRRAAPVLEHRGRCLGRSTD